MKIEVQSDIRESAAPPNAYISEYGTLCIKDHIDAITISTIGYVSRASIEDHNEGWFTGTCVDLTGRSVTLTFDD